MASLTTTTTLPTTKTMARTITTIHNSLIAAKQAEPELTALTSTSRTAIWRLILYIFAVGIFTLETFLDLFKIEVDDKIKNGIAGTRLWFAFVAMKYQHGDTLSWDANFIPSYLTIDSSKQIVKYAAPAESSSGVLLRVAKQVSGLPVKLSASDLAGLTAYMGEVKPAGISLRVTSIDADVVGLIVDLIHGAIYDGNAVRAEATNKITTLLQAYTFGENLRVNAIEDTLQTVTGVNDVRIRTLIASSGNFVSTIYSLSQGINNSQYASFSGYYTPGTITINTQSA